MIFGQKKIIVIFFEKIERKKKVDDLFGCLLRKKTYMDDNLGYICTYLMLVLPKRNFYIFKL